MKSKNLLTILVADDDDDDQILIRAAIEEERLCNDLRFVQDGEELLDYLKHRGKYEDASLSPPPALILLDLNMPKMDGFSALREIKADPELRSIPVIVLTTSQDSHAVQVCYNAGANSFVSKPISYEGLAAAIKFIGTYWFETVMLPNGGDRCR
jgi:CheY-like chemotaxis protein